MLVLACEHMEAVFPAAKDGQVTGGVSVGLARSRATPISPVLCLDITVARAALGRELDARVDGQATREPRRMVASVFATQAAVGDPPRRARDAPGPTELLTLEVVGERRREQRIFRLRRSGGRRRCRRGSRRLRRLCGGRLL